MDFFHKSIGRSGEISHDVTEIFLFPVEAECCETQKSPDKILWDRVLNRWIWSFHFIILSLFYLFVSFFFNKIFIVVYDLES